MRKGLTELLAVRVTPTMLRAINQEAERRMLTTPNVVRFLLSEQLTRDQPTGGKNATATGTT